MSANGNSGWNRSTGNQPTAKKTKAPARWKGIAAGLAVAVPLVALCLWFFSGGDDAPKAKADKERGRIKEVTPAKPKISAAEQEKLDHPGMVKFKGEWYPEYNSKGGHIWLSPKGVRYHSAKIHTNDLRKAYIQKELTYFDTPLDMEIAGVISAPLGAMRIGPASPYKESFKKQFIESLKVPIIVKEDDPENVKILKRAVIETKADLKARMDAGEDIVKIMNDNAKQMHELALYKNELQRMASQQANTAKSVEDAQLIYDAANRMLAERGVEPMKMPGFLQRKLNYQALKQNNTQDK